MYKFYDTVKESFGNIVEKRGKHFLFLPECLLPFQRRISIFKSVVKMLSAKAYDWTTKNPMKIQEHCCN